MEAEILGMSPAGVCRHTSTIASASAFKTKQTPPQAQTGRRSFTFLQNQQNDHLLPQNFFSHISYTYTYTMLQSEITFTKITHAKLDDNTTCTFGGYTRSPLWLP